MKDFLRWLDSKLRCRCESRMAFPLPDGGTMWVCQECGGCWSTTTWPAPAAEHLSDDGGEAAAKEE